jgi:hypothetical protein
MCNRARNLGEPETLIERFGGGWLTDKPMDNRFNPVELVPRGRAYVIRRDGKANGLDVMSWDLLGQGAAYHERSRPEALATTVRKTRRPMPDSADRVLRVDARKLQGG